MSRPKWKTLATRGALALTTALALFIGFVLIDAWSAFGKAATGERRVRMESSPQWDGSAFENPQPLWNDAWGMFAKALEASDHGSPSEAVPVQRTEKSLFATSPASGLRITWFGHSTMLIELDGYRVLTDPVWSERASPLQWIGPERWYAPPLSLEDLPSLDAVVISHDHYDHLDEKTVRVLSERGTKFIVPLGVGAHLAYWGVAESNLVELDWWERTKVGELEIVATPARHASGRTLIDKDATLWAGFALLGPRHRAYYSGDTGLFPALFDIGERLGPFDVTMIESGAYSSAWPDWHLGPEQAVRAHEMVRGKVLMPVHWGLFNLAYHGWTEPVERVLAAAERVDANVFVPRPGQSFEPTHPPSMVRWWPRLPFRTAAEDPVVSTKMDAP